MKKNEERIVLRFTSLCQYLRYWSLWQVFCSFPLLCRLFMQYFWLWHDFIKSLPIGTINCWIRFYSGGLHIFHQVEGMWVRVCAYCWQHTLHWRQNICVKIKQREKNGEWNSCLQYFPECLWSALIIETAERKFWTFFLISSHDSENMHQQLYVQSSITYTENSAGDLIICHISSHTTNFPCFPVQHVIKWHVEADIYNAISHE